MKYLLKALLLFFAVAGIIVNNSISYGDMLLILLIAAANIFKERFFDSVYMTAASFILTVIAANNNYSLGMLFGITVFDIVYRRLYLGFIPVLAAASYILWNKPYLTMMLLVMSVCGIFSMMVRNSEDKENRYVSSLDDERRLRYELEQAKMKLLNSAKDIAYLTEVKERNRIAREIHDNVGHSIAGILIQLQASYKLLDRNGEKSREIMKKSIDSLSDAVTLIRDTVYNIKPRENLGVDYIKCIIEEFGFCPIDFRYSGDFNSLPPGHMEILATNIKEALTNVAKHSKAANVMIKIDSNEKYARLYIKDDGIGCPKIKEGMGVSGMKERVENAGGSISVSSEDGFMIVCILPVDNGGCR